MVQINNTCIGCGKCVRDCIAGNLSLKEGKAVVAGGCFLCGHCVAICPKGAVEIPEYDMADVEECTPQNTEVDAQKLLRMVKFRRSIRDYQPRKVEREKLALLLDAGRYAATSKNTQGCRFIVVQDELDSFKERIWGRIGDALARPEEPENQWAALYRGFYEMHKAHPDVDYLFRSAPAVLFVAAECEIDAGLAAQCMELEAVSLGLGMLYNGYLRRAADGGDEIRQWLGAGEKKLYACALLGYPAVTYCRTAPRRTGDFVIK